MILWSSYDSINCSQIDVANIKIVIRTFGHFLLDLSRINPEFVPGLLVLFSV